MRSGVASEVGTEVLAVVCYWQGRRERRQWGEEGRGGDSISCSVVFSREWEERAVVKGEKSREEG